MNHTLFRFGFTKEVETKSGRLFDVSAGLSKTIQLPDKPVKCEFCNNSYAAKKYLDTHVRFKHPSQYSKLSQSSSGTTISSKDNDKSASQTANQTDESDERQETGDLTELEESLSGNNKANNRRGANRRKSYTIYFKIKTLDLLDTMKELKTKKLWEKVAERRGISKSLVVKWNKDRIKIRGQLALNKTNQNKGAARPTRYRRQLVAGKLKGEKYPLAAVRVVVEFKLRRAKGCKISKLWLRKKMKEKVEACYGKEEAEKFKASDNWFQRFKKRHNIAFRRRSNKKKSSANDGRERIQRFHRNLRKSLKTTRRRDEHAELDGKYGRWLPQNRYNIDQVPLPFVIDQDKTYETKGSEQVWVSQPSSGLDKRQATLQLCIRAEGEQNVKPAIVFRGKGNVKADEKAEYDKGVDVYFQTCAWMDGEVNMQWVEKTFVPGVSKSVEEKVIFADNVTFQQEKRFHDVCRHELNAIVYLLPENHTDKVQPIDAGFGKMHKTKIGEEMDKWLEEKDNLELWHDKLSARQRRILMTKWAGAAWRELIKDKAFIKKLFQKTGCLITIDGTDDDMVRPQGLDDYKF